MHDDNVRGMYCVRKPISYETKCNTVPTKICKIVTVTSFAIKVKLSRLFSTAL